MIQKEATFKKNSFLQNNWARVPNLVMIRAVVGSSHVPPELVEGHRLVRLLRVLVVLKQFKEVQTDVSQWGATKKLLM